MPAAMYVGTEDGLYVLGDGERHDLPGKRLTALVTKGGTTWALVGGAAVFTTGVSGMWRLVTRLAYRRGTCLHHGPDGVLIGLAGGHLSRLVNGMTERVASFETVEGRSSWTTPWGGPPDVRSISDNGKDTTYVNVHVGGILRSSDGGDSWQPTIDIDADVHQVLALPGRGPVLAATAHGLATSTDKGKTWTTRDDGLAAPYCRAVAVCGDTILLTASHGPTGGDSGIYRGSVDGGRLERCEKGLPATFSANIDTYCLAASDDMAAFGTADGSVYVSLDAGRSWEAAAEGLPPVHCLALT